MPAPMAAVKLAAGVIFNSEILYGALEFWAGLEPHWAFRFAFPQSARRGFCVGFARREVKNSMF